MGWLSLAKDSKVDAHFRDIVTSYFPLKSSADPFNPNVAVCHAYLT